MSNLKCAIPCIKIEDELTWLNGFITVINQVLKYCAKESPGFYIPITSTEVIGTSFKITPQVLMFLIYNNRYGKPATVADYDPVLLGEIFLENGLEFVGTG